MLDVIERKWNYFASELYTARILKFSAMLGAVFVASVTEEDSQHAQRHFARLGGAPAQLLRLLRARLAALCDSTLPGAESGPLGRSPFLLLVTSRPRFSSTWPRSPSQRRGPSICRSISISPR